MLTDLTLRNLKPRVTLYKVTDRDGMYVAITPTGSISFRFDYRINGRRETLTIGRYGYGGISLAAAGKTLAGQATVARWHFACVAETERKGSRPGNQDVW